ncbi:ATP-dependent DNA ligase [Candidatus Micrarchaeota archaeon]|nr:ATP-dependent DNA ligase [Candidatus Micrarchaeota archaeon]
MEFSKVAEIYGKLEGTAKRLQIMEDLAGLLKSAPRDEIRKIVYMTQGILLPEHEGVDLGVGDKLLVEALVRVSGQPKKKVDALYREKGDLGLVAEELLAKKSQQSLSSSDLSIGKVYSNFYKIATVSGEGSQEQKIRLLAELLSNASPSGGRVIARFVTGRLRLGAAESTIMDAISFCLAGDKSVKEKLERAFNMTNDLGLVAEKVFTDGAAAIENAKPHVFSPIRPALAERLPDAKAIIERLGECMVEAKYDGLRLQVHKKNSKVEIYSRRQEKVTHMFPDIVEAVRKQIKADEAIFEGEAIGFNEKTGEFVPFQETIQRKRKHGVGEYAKEIPLKLFAFDLLYADGKDLTFEKYSYRRKKLEKLIKKGTVVLPSKSFMVKKPEQLEKMFDDLVAQGLEGLMAKDLDAPYVAGARKFAWIKLKRSYSSKLADSVDVVILGFYYGKGKRTKFGFGGLLTGVSDESGGFKSIAKIGTGFSEKQMAEFRALLEKDVVKQKPANVDSLIAPDEWVVPKHVITVIADEITRSPVHTCGWRGKEGLALRFPRLTGFIRGDKSPKDATTEKEVLELYELQRQR